MYLTLGWYRGPEVVLSWRNAQGCRRLRFRWRILMWRWKPSQWFIFGYTFQPLSGRGLKVPAPSAYSAWLNRHYREITFWFDEDWRSEDRKLLNPSQPREVAVDTFCRLIEQMESE